MPLARTLEPEVMDTVEEAVDYDNMDHSGVNALFVDDLISLLVEKRGESFGRVVDVGAGTALIPLELLARDVSVTAILACDLSFEMLRLAAQHKRDESSSAPLLPVFCDAKRMPIADRSADAVISNSIIHHIPEPLTVFQEMKRVAAPNSLFFVRDLMRPESEERVEHFVRMYAGEENTHSQQMLRQSLHAALTVPEVQEMLNECGLPPEWVSATSDRHWTVRGIVRRPH